LNWIDALVIILLTYFAFSGWKKGIVQTIFRFLSLFVGSVVAFCYKDLLNEIILKAGISLQNPWLTWLSLILLFIISVILVQLLGYLISKLLKPTPLGPVDRISGALFGSFKVVFLCVLITFLLTKIPSRFISKGIIKNSMVFQTCLKILPLVTQSLNPHKVPLPEFGKKLKMDSLKKIMDFHKRGS